MKKFKPVEEAQPETPSEELSINQKSKLEKKKKKAEDEERKKREDKNLAEKLAYEAEVERKRKVEQEKVA